MKKEDVMRIMEKYNVSMKLAYLLVKICEDNKILLMDFDEYYS